MRHNRLCSAFTLIELLVVVAIIALLISILLPSLGRAREQGKTAKCLANLRTILTATHTYFVEYNDGYPYLTTDRGVCSWSYGGKTSDLYWKPLGFWTESRLKPFNRIIRGNQQLENDFYNGAVLERRIEYPEYQCPSDGGSYQRVFSQPPDKPPLSISAYDDVGTSYHFNIYYFIDTNLRNTFESWEKLHKMAIRELLGKNSARFVMYWEDPMDFALGNEVQVMGNHKNFSRHSAGFLDGHAENRKFDTRRFGGGGWVALNPSWIKRQGPATNWPIRYVPLAGGYSRRNDEPYPE